jgi:predicted transcriptional regulator
LLTFSQENLEEAGEAFDKIAEEFGRVEEEVKKALKKALAI